jgi:hypothetical protein
VEAGAGRLMEAPQGWPMEAEAGEVDPPGRAAGGADRGQHRVRVASVGRAGGGVLRGDKMRRPGAAPSGADSTATLRGGWRRRKGSNGGRAMTAQGWRRWLWAGDTMGARGTVGGAGKE